MNNKENIRIGIEKAVKSNNFWLEQTRSLVRGEANHIVQQPIAHTESEFGQWLLIEGKKLNASPLYLEVESLHSEFHQIYDAIYTGAEQVYDAESHKAVSRSCAKMESHANLIMMTLEKIQDSLEGKYTQESNINKMKVEVVDRVDVNFSDTPSSQAVEGSPVSLRRQLKEQDLFQLKQEQQLTELELKQLEDRQYLTVQGVKQVAQYQTLKKQEIEHRLSEHNVLEESNINAIYLGQQDLTRIKEEIVEKTDELEQLTLVDQKLDQRKAEEEEKERRILADFDKAQSLDKQSIIQLEKQRKKWEDEADNLKKQLALIEQDLETLAEKLRTKQLIIDESNQKKEVKLQELAQHSQLQNKLNGHKIKVRESKQEELEQLVQEQAKRKKELRALEIESAKLENQKLDISKGHKKELRELDDQQRFKKMTIEKLEGDKSRKKQELKEIIHQQAVIQESLKNMDDKSQANAKKLLEEV